MGRSGLGLSNVPGVAGGAPGFLPLAGRYVILRAINTPTCYRNSRQ